MCRISQTATFFCSESTGETFHGLYALDIGKHDLPVIVRHGRSCGKEPQFGVKCIDYHFKDSLEPKYIMFRHHHTDKGTGKDLDCLQLVGQTRAELISVHGEAAVADMVAKHCDGTMRKVGQADEYKMASALGNFEFRDVGSFPGNSTSRTLTEATNQAKEKQKAQDEMKRDAMMALVPAENLTEASKAERDRKLGPGRYERFLEHCKTRAWREEEQRRLCHKGWCDWGDHYGAPYCTCGPTALAAHRPYREYESTRRCRCSGCLWAEDRGFAPRREGRTSTKSSPSKSQRGGDGEEDVQSDVSYEGYWYWDGSGPTNYATG